MSVYPILEVNSLNQRCLEDINQFLKEQSIQPNPVENGLLLESGGDRKAFKEKFKEKINVLNPTFGKEDSANYVDKISTLTPTEQQEKWILRTYLVYQLLIILTLSLTNRELYNSVFGEIELISLNFRDDVPSRLGYQTRNIR